MLNTILIEGNEKFVVVIIAFVLCLFWFSVACKVCRFEWLRFDKIKKLLKLK